jgi:hypothetical protein
MLYVHEFPVHWLTFVSISVFPHMKLIPVESGE